MKTHVLANNVVYLDFAPAEHLALGHTLYEVMASIEPSMITSILGVAPSDAYEFVYSVYVAEDAARDAGVSWLQDEGHVGAVSKGATPVIGILFTDEGSSWRLTVEQLGFVELCVAEASRPQRFPVAS
jgi:hypothetical protein